MGLYFVESPYRQKINQYSKDVHYSNLLENTSKYHIFYYIWHFDLNKQINLSNAYLRQLLHQTFYWTYSWLSWVITDIELLILVAYQSWLNSVFI